jgi:hypothetical protein
MTVDKLEAQFASWFGSIFEDELQEPQPRAFEIDPKQQALEALREKLRSIRVDRGASAAEEETAKKKLADLNRRSG